MLFLSIANIKQRLNQKDYKSNLDSVQVLIEQRMYESSIPAVSIGIIIDDKIVYSNGFGILDRETNVPVNKNSIYQIASVSKTITGIIAHNLVIDGILDLNQSVTFYLKDALSQEAQERFSTTKVRHLLQHTAGIPNDGFSVYRNWQLKKYWTKGFSTKELISELNELDMEFQSGTQFKYSNSGYALLGLILETISGKTAQELVEKYISNKYGLPNTTVELTGEQRKQLTRPYLPNNRKTGTQDSFWELGLYSSGYYSSADDLIKLMHFQMTAYKMLKLEDSSNALILNDLTGLDNKSQKLDGYTSNYGMGIFKYVQGEKLIYQHSGDSDGYGSTYFFDPNKGYGVVVLTSSCGLDFQQLITDIGRVLEKKVYKPR